MKYNSVPEYFYKLYGRLYALILLPLLCFGLLYWEMKTGRMDVFSQDIRLNQMLLLTMIIVLLVEWIASFFLFRSKLKSILTLGSLGERLDRYYRFTLIRFSMMVSGLILLAVGFFLTRDQYFTILFVASMVGLGFLWPTSAKVCDDLNLKGDERKLILYKLDKLS
jgi:uncharacterized membrane protein YwzB